MIKGGSDPFRQEPINEVIASKIADELNIPDFVDSINKMIVLDFIIANEDRHFNNFGAIRDAETLKFISFSPIFDSGS